MQTDASLGSFTSNMLTRVENGVSYTQGWNQENRLQTVTVNGATTTFTYDGDGKLVKKTVGITTTYYVNAGYEKTGSVVTKYYYAGSQRVAMRVCTGTNGSCGPNGATSTLTYLHADHLGSASLSTNATGGKVSEMRYYPYGEMRSGAMATDRQYTGQRREIGLGLYDYNARYYDPYLNRFIQADSIVPGAASGTGGGAATLGYDSNTRLTPLTVNLGEFAAQINAENREVLQFGAFFQWDSKTRQEHNVPMGPANPQALNRYAYCLNNPLRYTDPTGHEWVVIGEHQYTLSQLRELSRNMYNMSNALAVVAIGEELAGLALGAALSPVPPAGVVALVVIGGCVAINAIEAIQVGALHDYLEDVIAEAEKRGYNESDTITLTLSDVRKEGLYNAAVCLSSDLTPNEGLYTFLITASALRTAFTSQ